MKFPFSRIVVCLAAVATPLTGSCSKPHVETRDSQAVVAFKDHVQEYVALHEKLEATIPKLPQKATPQEVDANQRALAALIQTARADAKPGEFFTPGIQTLIKRVIGDVLASPGGETVKGSIMDENPGLPQILVNEKYPSSVPLSTMPPQILERLPKLIGELEYRFIGPRLILVDTEADIILDFTDPVLDR